MTTTVRTQPTFLSVEVKGFLSRKRGKDIRDAIERGMLNGARLALPRVKIFSPKDQTFLADGWYVAFQTRPRRAAQIVNTNTPAKVGAMERGRKPGKFPPPGPIRRWVQRKLGITGKAVKSVAFLVARKIATLGIQVPLLVSGKGAMLRRTVQFLGANFFGRLVTDEVAKLK
jgi:hypothetical protein